jgi:hypothetical protein
MIINFHLSGVESWQTVEWAVQENLFEWVGLCHFAEEPPLMPYPKYKIGKPKYFESKEH